MRAGIFDLYEGLQAWRIWHLIGVSSIRLRYSRSRLGQVWLTLSTGLFILMYGGLFSVLFHQEPKVMLPYVGVSMIIWTAISGAISNATTCLVSAHQYFENQYASFSIAIFVVIYREAITFAHEAVIIFAILLYFGLLGNVHVLSMLIGFVFVVFTLIWVSYALAILCVRYRDLIQVMASVLRAAFFLTPIFWRESMFPEGYRHYLIFNPFHVLLSVVRDPLLGIDTPDHYLIYGFGASILGFFLTMIFIGKYRRRIIFWI
ncbi:MAG: ABC transporter permease [Parvibaculaceae bacterium]